MNIVLNDFGGYAFIAQLARELASHGHTVNHCFCDSLSSTPHGNVTACDALGSYEARAIRLTKPFQKYAFFTRRKQEKEYGARVAKLVSEIQPDAVISANTPLDALSTLWRSANSIGARKIFWLQDILGVAALKILRKRLPLIGAGIGQHYVRLERRLLLDSDAVIPISESFLGYLSSVGVSRQRITVIENWAPLKEIPCLDKSNNWSQANRLDEKFVFLYSGTLSMKHNPDFLLRIAKSVKPLGAEVVVRSQGLGADWLHAQNSNGAYPNLTVDSYVAYRDLPSSLASADVLVAVLEPEAGEFSVPSKVLSYLCAGRAVLLVAPQSNLASVKVRVSGGGVVVDSGHSDELEAISAELVISAARTRDLGRNARSFAESEFDIAGIGQKFMQVLQSTSSSNDETILDGIC